MAADLAADREARAWTEAVRDLRLAILEFADEERFEAEAGAAAAHYWNDYYNAETLPLMSPSEAERFLDWFAYDYTLPSGERVIDLFRNEQGESLSPPQRELLEQWAGGAPMGGYELTGYERQTLRLKEYLSGEMLDVYEPGGHGNAPLGSIILGRPVRVRDQYEFFTMPAYISPDEITDLREKLVAARAADGEKDADSMRRHNVLYIHHALEQAKIAGRPPVARLDPRHTAEGIPPRQRHQRVRIKGPAGQTENAPQLVQAHRKAI
jgi:hypothetical protein